MIQWQKQLHPLKLLIERTSVKRGTPLSIMPDYDTGYEPIKFEWSEIGELILVEALPEKRSFTRWIDVLGTFSKHDKWRKR